MSTFDKPPLPVKPILPKVWITKYALTKGVFTAVNVVQGVGTSDRMITVSVKSGRHMATEYFHKPQWHTTEEDARAQVQKMVNAALKAIKKKVAKLDDVMASVQGPVPTKPWA